MNLSRGISFHCFCLNTKEGSFFACTTRSQKEFAFCLRASREIGKFFLRPRCTWVLLLFIKQLQHPSPYNNATHSSQQSQHTQTLSIYNSNSPLFFLRRKTGII